MKISGIVCEYNPFHNGHAYHIEKTRQNGATHIVAVMSGNFVQRGDAAVLDKFTRAELAIKSGVDMVVELPVVYSLAPAEIFARGAVYLLESLGCVDEISFGSECGDVHNLLSAMDKADEAMQSERLKELMNSGYTYPRAVTAILREKDAESAEIISEPNNILAVEYLRALNFLKSDIKPFTVRRIGALHDSTDTVNMFASASYIRQNPESAEKFMPKIWADAFKSGTAMLENLERVILYKIRTISREELSCISDITEGLTERIYGNQADSLERLFDSVKTKCYTMARIKRIILSMLIGITKSDTDLLPPYARVIAFNEKGIEILAAAKKSRKIPVGTSLAKLGRLDNISHRFSVLESTATDIYNLARKEIYTAGGDYKVKITRS